MQELSKRIKDLRIENNLTQTELSKIIHVSQTTIAKWETGDRMPTVEFVVLLAKAFHVSTDYLLGLED